MLPGTDAAGADRPAEPAAGSPSPEASRRRQELRKAMLLLQSKVRSRVPPYHCFLDEQPSPLVPQAALQRLRSQTQAVELGVNPGLQLLAPGDLPDDVRRRALPIGGLLGDHTIAWVTDPGTGVWMPFWVRDAWLDLLHSLVPGAAAPAGLPSAMRDTLAQAMILVPDGFAVARQARCAQASAVAHAGFQARGHATVQDLVHPFQLAAMRRYYRALVESGGLQLGDGQVADRYAIHNETVATGLHAQLAGLVGDIAGEPVKPSYVYFASYLPGAELKRHTDREQCEFSISLLVDYAPEPEGACGWPLLLERPASPAPAHAADLAIGDALVYRGRELVHFRPPLPAGHRSTSLFLHYVRKGFTGPLG